MELKDLYHKICDEGLRYEELKKELLKDEDSFKQIEEAIKKDQNMFDAFITSIESFIVLYQLKEHCDKSSLNAKEIWIINMELNMYFKLVERFRIQSNPYAKTIDEKFLLMNRMYIISQKKEYEFCRMQATVCLLAEKSFQSQSAAQ